MIEWKMVRPGTTLHCIEISFLIFMENSEYYSPYRKKLSKRQKYVLAMYLISCVITPTKEIYCFCQQHQFTEWTKPRTRIQKIHCKCYSLVGFLQNYYIIQKFVFAKNNFFTLLAKRAAQINIDQFWPWFHFMIESSAFS